MRSWVLPSNWPQLRSLSALVCLTLAALVPLASRADSGSVPVTDPSVQQGLSALRAMPILFEKNEGQFPDAYDFVFRSAQGKLGISPTGITFSQVAPSKPASKSLRLEWVGASEQNEGEGRAPSSTRLNYINALNANKNRTVPGFHRVFYREVLPGVDVEYYGNGERLEYDFIVAPGADVSSIALRLHGADQATVDTDGNLHIHSGDRQVLQHKPIVYQQTAQGRKVVDARYTIADKDLVQFAVADYDRNLPLVIDPVVEFATYFGSTRPIILKDLAIDANGDIYLFGISWGQVVGEPADRNSIPGSDETSFFLSKISRDWSRVIYTSHIAWVNSYGAEHVIAANASGEAFIGFSTNASAAAANTTIPFHGLPSAEQNNAYGSRFVLAKVAANGSSFLWSTGAACVGGYLNVRDIAVDGAGRPVAALASHCPTFPLTEGSYQNPSSSSPSPSSGVISFNSSGAIHYAYEFGGSGYDSPSFVSVAQNGDVVVAGTTTSTNFPTTASAISRVYAGNTDVFFSRFSGDGAAMLVSTYYGGSAVDDVTAMHVTGNGDMVVGLHTESPILPGTAGSLNPSKGAAIAAIVRLPASLQWVEWATFYPGLNRIRDIRLDSNDAVWLTGMLDSTYGSAPETVGKLTSISPVAQYHLARLNSLGNQVQYATPLFSQDAIVGNYRFLSIQNGTVSMIAGAFSGVYPPITTDKPMVYWNDWRQGGHLYLQRINTANPTICTYLVSPRVIELPSSGGDAEFTISAPTGCPWLAAPLSTEQFNSLREQGIGNGTVKYTMPSRNPSLGQISYDFNLNGVSFSVKQGADPCGAPTVTPTTLTVEATGGSRNVTLNYPEGCEWTPTWDVTWLSSSLTKGVKRTGSASFSVTVESNSSNARTGSIALGSISLPVSQSGSSCTINASASPATIPAEGGSSTISVTTSAQHCTWQAAASNRVTLSGTTSGTGNGSFVATVASNPTNTSLQESIVVGGKTVALAQQGMACNAVLQTAQTTFGPEQGTFAVSVQTTGSSCGWGPVISADWLVPAGGVDYFVGSGVFAAMVKPNYTGATRTATITIYDKVLTITQLAQNTVLVYVSADSHSGVPFKLNGVSHVTPAQFAMVPGTSAVFSTGGEVVSEDRYLLENLRWTASGTTSLTYQVTNSPTAVVNLASDAYPGVRVRMAGQAESDGAQVVQGPTVTLRRTIGEWNYYHQRVEGTGAIGAVSFRALAGSRSSFSYWRDWLQGSISENPTTLSLQSPIDIVANYLITGSGPQPVGAIATPSKLAMQTVVGVSQVLTASALITKTGAQETSFVSSTMECTGAYPPFTFDMGPRTTPFTFTTTINTAAVAHIQPTVLDRCSVKFIPAIDGQEPLYIPLSLTILAQGSNPNPNPGTGESRIEALVNAASYKAGPLAIGSIATVFGNNMATGTGNASALPLPQSLHGARLVLHRDGLERDCDLFYASPGQINFLIPDAFPTGPAYLTLYRDGVKKNYASVTIAEVRPTLFTANSDGEGAPAGQYLTVLGTQQTPGELFTCPQGVGSCVPKPLEPRVPGDRDYYLVLYGTGIRYRTAMPVVTIGGVPAEVTYSGPQWSFVGLDQLNVKVPRQLVGTGVQELKLQIENAVANTVSIHF